MGVPITDPKLHGLRLRLQSVTPGMSLREFIQTSCGCDRDLGAAFFVSSLHAGTTIVAVCGLGPIKSTDGGITWSVIPVNVSNGILSGQPTLRVIG